MIEVVVVGEGQTEETFIRDVLAPRMAGQSVFLRPRLIGTSMHGRGGALSRDRVLRYLRNTLRERANVYVTTFSTSMPWAVISLGAPKPRTSLMRRLGRR